MSVIENHSLITHDRPPEFNNIAMRRIRREVRLFCSTHPALFGPYARLTGLPFRLTDETTILVESYPRSGNSFFEAAFTRAHGGRERVAHHSHAAAQVLAGVGRGLPVIVLIREPVAAIASFYDLNFGDYPISLCTREYTAFYRALRRVIEDLVVVETSMLESCFHDLMVKLRDDYGCDVAPYQIDAEIRADLFKSVDETGRQRGGRAEHYSQDRSDTQKQARRRQLDAISELIREPQNVKLLDAAQTEYRFFMEHVF